VLAEGDLCATYASARARRERETERRAQEAADRQRDRAQLEFMITENEAQHSEAAVAVESRLAAFDRLNDVWAETVASRVAARGKPASRDVRSRSPRGSTMNLCADTDRCPAFLEDCLHAFGGMNVDAWDARLQECGK
jgi:hypothetical protein